MLDCSSRFARYCLMPPEGRPLPEFDLSKPSAPEEVLAGRVILSSECFWRSATTVIHQCGSRCYSMLLTASLPFSPGNPAHQLESRSNYT